jgi:hypothetical protein
LGGGWVGEDFRGRRDNYLFAVLALSLRLLVLDLLKLLLVVMILLVYVVQKLLESISIVRTCHAHKPLLLNIKLDYVKKEVAIPFSASSLQNQAHNPRSS